MIIRPWNIDVESLANLELKLSLVKCPPTNSPYQLDFHLRKKLVDTQYSGQAMMASLIVST